MGIAALCITHEVLFFKLDLSILAVALKHVLLIVCFTLNRSTTHKKTPSCYNEMSSSVSVFQRLFVSLQLHVFLQLVLPFAGH